VLNTEKSLQKKIYDHLWFAAAVVVCNSLLAGYLAFWGDSELKSYNILVFLLDILYWIIMLPGIIIICFNRFRWYLGTLAVLLYIAAVLISFGSL
jgi:hypothetical protein